MKNIYSVAQVNSYIKNMFTQDFMLASILVKGEVSNCKYHSSGHIYFTLKDEMGSIACVMFAGNRKGLSFTLREGQQVVAGGSIDVYERDGRYQMYAREIMLQGAGQLYEKFNRLKKELEEMGMFSQEYKRKIPAFIHTLGVVTAPTGAAVQDIINIARRRNPYIQIILYPAVVQGDLAAASIVNGIHALERLEVDTMIVGRGGGSIEDLWAFNEEIVARAIFECGIPVISAVGHETDTTIADFVADLRAPTPSAAAELAVCDIRMVQEKIINSRFKLQKLILSRITAYRTRAEYCGRRLQYLSPYSRIRERRTYALQQEDRLQKRMQQILTGKRHLLELYIEQLKGLSPLDKLNHGFSYATYAQGRNLTSISQVKLLDKVVLQLKDGKLEAEIKKIMETGREL